MHWSFRLFQPGSLFGRFVGSTVLVVVGPGRTRPPSTVVVVSGHPVPGSRSLRPSSLLRRDLNRLGQRVTLGRKTGLSVVGVGCLCHRNGDGLELSLVRRVGIKPRK